MNKILITLAFAVLLATGGGLNLHRLNDFERDGELRLATLERPVRVLRDDLGVAYVFAENTPDLIRAQGFVTAQNRLFQLEAYRAIARGELAEAVGVKGLESDTRMRVLGVRRNALRHSKALSESSRDFLRWFVEGLNAYVQSDPGDHHLELALGNFRAQPWTVDDLVTLLHYVHFRQATNYRIELVAQRLIDRLGIVRAAQILPLSVNPDRRHAVRTPRIGDRAGGPLGFEWSAMLPWREDAHEAQIGSNNWVVAPGKSASGHAIVANDPHLDSRILPGIWHPIGLFTPEIQAIGAALPGLPGILSGRTAHVAFGVTNSYGDVQDLYIETVDPDDPDHYLDSGRSLPFRSVTETIRIRDDDATGGYRDHALTIRFTRRGPVLSDHGLAPGGDKLIVLRSTTAQIMSPTIGIDAMLSARSAGEFEHALEGIDLLLFNFVYADVQGHIGQRATGAVPRRAGGHGAVPRRPPADGSDDWLGFISKREMPGAMDPEKGWLGTANNDVRPDGYPYYYSSYFAPSYRYRRIREALDAADKTTVADHWRLIQDDRNLQSRRLRPVIVRALEASDANADLAFILAKWDGVDALDSPAPLIYHTIYQHLALATFEDELGEDLARDMLSQWYFWQERFDAMVAAGKSRWLDDVTTTGRVETVEDLVARAARTARAELSRRYGEQVSAWRWGDAHTITFVSPLRRVGFGRDLLGAGIYAMSGSRDTLKSAGYRFGDGFTVDVHDSLRMVTDLGDAEKITAVVPGGVVGRQFHENQADQVLPWVTGEMRYWWFSRAAIEAHARHEQRLVP